MTNRINVGFIGAGFISQVAHIPNYVDNDLCNIVALAELRKSLGAAVCAKWGISRLYDNHHDLLKDPSIDAVIAIVRRHHTAPIALDIIKSNKHLFTEKPFAQIYSVGNNLVNEAKARNLIYGVGFMRRYDDAVRRAKIEFDKIMESGELGSLLFTRLFLSAGGDYCNIDGDIKSDEPKPMHRVWDVAPSFVPLELHNSFEHFVNVCGHDINLLRYFFPDDVSVESAFYEPGKGAITIFDLGHSYASFEWMDTLQPTRWDEGLEFRFQKGFIKLTLQPAFLRNQPSTLEIYRDYGRSGGNTTQYHSDWTWAFKNECNGFLESLKSGLQPISNAYDALADLRLIEEVWRHIIK
jgi:predicted dehydrogenase